MDGKIISGRFKSALYQPSSEFDYQIYVPGDARRETTGLVVIQDGLNMAEVEAMEALRADGTVPPCVMIGISSGNLRATQTGGVDRGMRMTEYDAKGRKYPDFLAEEFIPALTLREGLEFSSDPALHMISGGSSGGCCAWNAAWYRNDYFKRAFLSSPSMLAMGGMDEFLNLIRKCEPRPIRAFITMGEDEPNDYFGSSYCVISAMKSALEYAGYEFGWEYFPGEGHCCRRGDAETLKRVYSYIWQGWSEGRLDYIRQFAPRLLKLVDPASQWLKSGCVFDSKRVLVTDKGSYSADGARITFTDTAGKQLVYPGFSCITAIALSADRWRLYVSDAASRRLYALSILEDGSLNDRYDLCLLHTDSEALIPGAYDIAVDAHDRIFAATGVGVQCVRSFGLIDVILPLPKDLPAVKIAYDDAENILYVKDGEGKVYERTLSEQNRGDTPSLRAVSYYD